MDEMYRNFAIIFTILIFLLAAAAYFFLGFGRGIVLKKATVTVKGHEFQVQIADNLASRTRGLSGRDALAENEGLYFIFQKPDMYGFWMKDMNFPIDIIWIKDGKIVSVTENAKPEPTKSLFSLPIFYPSDPVDRVLEVNGGLAAKYGFSAGDPVTINF